MENGDRMWQLLLSRFEAVEGRVGRIEKFGVGFGIAIVLELLAIIVAIKGGPS